MAHAWWINIITFFWFHCFFYPQIVDIDLHEGDIFAVYDGKTGEATEITKNILSRQGDMLFTTGDSAYISFTTDLKDSGRGFNLTYQSGGYSWPFCVTFGLMLKFKKIPLLSFWFSFSSFHFNKIFAHRYVCLTGTCNLVNCIV